MKIELENDVVRELVNLIEEDLAYVHEDLERRYGTVEEAMEAFDDTVLVGVLHKLDRLACNRLAKAVREELELRLPSGSPQSPEPELEPEE